ncbi:phage tail protein [Bacillus spizizenii]|nr:phage tail protein [Bacillus spizizenii]
MAIIAVKDLTGIAEPLPGFYATRSNGVEGEKTLNVLGYKTHTNQHGYKLVKNENILIFKNEEYIIKTHKEKTFKNGVGVEVTALHRIFDDLINYRVYDEISGTFRIDALLDFALKGSGYTFEVDKTDLPTSVKVENFGWDNSLSLLRSILEKFGAEFDYSGKHIRIAKKIGTKKDEPFLRYKYNISEPEKEIDTSSFATYIRGYGKQRDDGSYVVQAEYTSPLAKIYGIKHAEPVKDERFQDKESLLAEMKKKLGDSLEISLKFTAIELRNMGFDNVQKGDYLWCVIEPFDINVQLRVLNIEDYSNDSKPPVFSFGSITKKASDIIVDFDTTKKTVEKVIDTSSGKIKADAINTSGLATKSELDAHVKNQEVHVTAAEKETWNSKESGGAAANLEARLTNITWASPGFKNSWTQYSDTVGTYPAQYGKDMVGTIFLRGVVRGGTIGTNSPVFTLPVGFRPQYSHFFTGSAGPKAFYTGVVKSNGDVCIESSTNATPNAFIALNTQFKAN